MIKLVLKLLVFFCCLAELHASRQRLIANVFYFCLGFFLFCFYCIAQRFCKTERPLFSFAPADRMIALISLCQFVLSRPSCLTQQQYYLSVHLSYFRNCLVCMFWFEETACLLSFKWPLNTPKEDLIWFVFHPPFSVSKGMFQFTVMSFVFCAMLPTVILFFFCFSF